MTLVVGQAVQLGETPTMLRADSGGNTWLNTHENRHGGEPGLAWDHD